MTIGYVLLIHSGAFQEKLIVIPMLHFDLIKAG